MFRRWNWKFLYIELCVCRIHDVVCSEIICLVGQVISENVHMLVDLNIRSDLKKNVDHENFFNLKMMKMAHISFHQKTFV